MESLPEVERVFGPTAFRRMLLWGWPDAQPPDVLVFLGGDQSLSALLARRLRIPALAYTHERAQGKAFRLFCLPDQPSLERAVAKGANREKLVVVGNLMADAIAGQKREREPLVLFFPGSRPYQVLLLASYWLRVAKELKAQFPELKFQVPLSPFISEELLAEAFARPQLPGALPGELVREGEELWVQGADLKLHLLPAEGKGDPPPRFEAMLRASLALTLPGTNNMELAAAGTPHLVVAPTFELKDQPFEGLLGLLSKVPGLGAYFQRRAVAKLKAQPFLTLPNVHAGKQIVPELIGEIEPQEAAAEAGALLGDEGRRREMEEALRAVAGPPGAGSKFAQLILKVGAE